MLIGENSIIRQAKKAKEETGKAKELEQVKLSLNSSMTNNLSKDSLIEDLSNNGFNVELTGNNMNFKTVANGWVFEGEYNRYHITEDGNVMIVADRTGLKIGDYLDYTYDEAKTKYLIEGKYSGYLDNDSNGNLIYKNQEIKQNPNLNWQIFHIDEDTGEILLISSKSTNSSLILQGSEGYNNGVYLMNNICKEHYSNKKLGAIARSINLDDISNAMNDAGRRYIENSTTQSTYSVRYLNRYYPSIYQYELGAGIDSEAVSKDGIHSSYSYKNSLIEDNYHIANSFITVTRTVIYRDKPAEYFSTNIYADGLNNPVYDLIFKPSYSLATRCRSFNANDYADFSIQRISGGTTQLITYYSLYSSNGTANRGSSDIRPIVSLNSNILIDLNSGDGTSSDTAYSIVEINKK